MVNELEAASCLGALSRRRTLTEFDAARALSSAAQLLANDPFALSPRTRKPAVRPRLRPPRGRG
jgi:hypothetical protein